MECDKLGFTSFDDFFVKKKRIRNMYRKLNIDNKWKYKRYFYSNKFNEKEQNKDCIWNYLNENENSKKDIIKKYKERKKIK